jgi:hypothetical protein
VAADSRRRRPGVVPSRVWNHCLHPDSDDHRASKITEQDDQYPSPHITRVERCTHAAWVRPVDAAGIGRPKHLTLCLPFKQLQCPASFRVGWHHLEVHSGRLKHPTVPRADRLCKLCSVGGGRFHGQESGPHVEDLVHFMLECPAYDDIRSRFPRIFGFVAGPDPSVRLRSIFCGDHQEQLAACLFSMNEFRSECLKPAPPNLGGGGREGEP